MSSEPPMALLMAAIARASWLRSALRVEMAGALHGQADLVAERLQEPQLVLGEQLARAGRPRSGRRGSPSRSAAGCRRAPPARAAPRRWSGMRGHCVVLRACMRWPDPEHLGAQALAEPVALDLLEVDAATRRARRPGGASGPSRRPMKIQAVVQPEAAEDLLEGDVQDGLDLVLAVDLGGDLGEDLQLALAGGDVAFQRTDAILVGDPQAFAVLIGHAAWYTPKTQALRHAPAPTSPRVFSGLRKGVLVEAPPRRTSCAALRAVRRTCALTTTASKLDKFPIAAEASRHYDPSRS